MCGSKYEDRMTKKENAGLMESLGLRSIRGRERERERERIHRKKNYIQKALTRCNTQYMCVFNEHVLYKS